MFNTSRLLIHIIVLLCSLAVANLAWADPSGRVAHVTDVQGTISYSPAGESEWVGVVRNRPLILGDRLWSDQNSQAEFQVGSAAVRLGPNTSVEILDLNDNIAQIQLSQGSVNVRIRRLYRGQVVEVATPMLAFSINRAGRYRIDVDPYDGQTTISVWKGAGTVYGEGASFRIKAGEAVAFYDVNLRDYEFYGLAEDDDFDRYTLARDQRWDQSVSLQYVDDDLVGYADLDTHGSWGVSASYGNVWYPTRVSAGWAPYRDGYWVWQEPWGWTWVDYAPWGFAPSHYGRWVSESNRWGWVPGPRHVRPIYAPAVVAFVGGSGWDLSVSTGGGYGYEPIGWFPIGPREVYVPSYHASRDYFDRVNVNNTVINNTTITNVYNNYSSGTINVDQVRYANRNVESAVTVVPSNVFVNAQSVAPAVIRIDRKKLSTGGTMRVAQIAPSGRSVIGAGKAVKARPAKEVYDRQVVVHNAPPPAEIPFAKREKQLQKNPGQPVSASPTDTVQAKEGKPARNVRVVSDQQAAIDARTAATGRKSASGTTEKLDRSAKARKAPASVKGTGQQAAPQQQADTDKQADQQEKKQADADKRTAQQKQREADSDKQAAQQKQREADSDKQAAKQQQQQADADRQAAQQKQADADKQTAQQKQHQADSDKQSAKKQQQQADVDQQAAQQKQKQADADKQAAQQKQHQADVDNQAAQAQQRQADSDKRAAQQQQRKADSDKHVAQQKQLQADADKQAAQQKQHQANSDKQAAKQQQQQADAASQPAQQQQHPQGKPNSNQQKGETADQQSPEPDGQAASKQPKSKGKGKSKSQTDCEREAEKNNTDPSLCRDEL